MDGLHFVNIGELNSKLILNIKVNDAQFQKQPYLSKDAELVQSWWS